MTRRLTVSILAGIVLTLVLTGLGTLLLTRAEDRRATEAELLDQVKALTVVIDGVPAFNPQNEQVRARLNRVRAQLNLESVGLLLFNDGRLAGELPAGVSEQDLLPLADSDDLTVSGNHGDLVFAASAVPRQRAPTLIVVATRQAGTILAPAARWFLASSGISIVVGIAVATVLGRRLTRPIRQARDATQRIASGELDARVEGVGGEGELAELAAAVNDMAASLERAQGLERQFLLSVSHDLRTPLTSIRGYAEAISDGTAPDADRAAAVIQSEARRLERLVADLLDLAKLDARQFSFRPHAVDLAEIVADAVDGFRHQARAAGVNLSVEGPDAPVMAWVDPDRLGQVIANLLENGLKYAAMQLHVGYGVGQGRPQVVVSDDGPGIADDDLPHVFERLYVSRRRPQRKESGSGLGLAIVRELTEAMGGQVAARPRDGGGTQFVVDLLSPSSSADQR